MRSWQKGWPLISTFAILTIIITSQYTFPTKPEIQQPGSSLSSFYVGTLEDHSTERDAVTVESCQNFVTNAETISKRVLIEMVFESTHHDATLPSFPDLCPPWSSSPGSHISMPSTMYQHIKDVTNKMWPVECGNDGVWLLRYKEKLWKTLKFSGFPSYNLFTWVNCSISNMSVSEINVEKLFAKVISSLHLSLFLQH